MSVLLRKTFRIHNNPLLKKSKNVFLMTPEYEFKNSPFSSQGNYLLFHKDKLNNFALELVNNGFQVDICHTLPKLEVCYIDTVPGFFEEVQLDENTKSLDNFNYLIPIDKVVLDQLPPKFGFSKFRKLFEKKILNMSFNVEEEKSVAADFLNQYLSTTSPSHYFETRNAFTGNQFSTRLSQFLNLGSISPRYILKRLNLYEKEFGGNKSTYWIKFELLWREYFHWLYEKHKTDFFRSDGLNGGNFDLPKMSLEEYLSNFTHPLLVAMNKELMETGFLSNRCRQIYVSYLIHHTDLDWRYGAWFFQHNLHDYDLCSNWGNWLYGSGHGTDSKGPRYFKIEKQLENYDPKGLYLEKWGE